jgi:hypothetical protein
MTVHNIGGHGFKAHNSDSIFYINCDAYNCADTLQIASPGNTAAGFSITSSGVRTGPISYYGCRAWHCSDDGFDGLYVGPIYYDRCWSWNHGYLSGGAGGGFKWGLIYLDFPLHVTIKNCITAYNKFGGVNENDDDCARTNMFVYNCTSYKNASGFIAWNPSSNLDNENVYMNNISYNNSNGNSWGSGYVHSHNSWDIPIMVNDTDFVSLDYTEMLKPRKIGGSLPDIDFMKLKATSSLIDKGTTETGLPYAGDAPDLGAWEFGLQPSSGNNYPSVEIISPSNYTTFTAPATIIINANPSDYDGTVTKVEFFNGDSSIGYKTSSPWSMTWEKVPVGTYSLTAIATDDQDAKTTSAAVIVNVRSDNINLYPNPNNGSFTLALKDFMRRNGVITISSTDGKIVYKGTMSQEELTKQFNLQDIKDGCYLLVLYEYEILTAKKFIKE